MVTQESMSYVICQLVIMTMGCEMSTLSPQKNGKLIALNVSKKKWERAYTSSLMAHMKALEQKEASSPRKSRRQEIIKLRAEISQVETKRNI